MKLHLVGVVGVLAMVGLVRAGNVDDETAGEVRKVAGPMVKELVANLSAELMKAIAEKGPEHAVEVCNLKALPLTRSLLDGNPQIVSIRRTSNKLRNPENAPDAVDREAIGVLSADAEGSPRQDLVLNASVEGEETLRYYRAIRVAGNCLLCHGPVDAIPKGVREVLAEKYPDDLATGYLEGDFRGVVRVETRRARAK